MKLKSLISHTVWYSNGLKQAVVKYDVRHYLSKMKSNER